MLQQDTVLTELAADAGLSPEVLFERYSARVAEVQHSVAAQGEFTRDDLDTIIEIMDMDGPAAQALRHIYDNTHKKRGLLPGKPSGEALLAASGAIGTASNITVTIDFLAQLLQSKELDDSVVYTLLFVGFGIFTAQNATDFVSGQLGKFIPEPLPDELRFALDHDYASKPGKAAKRDAGDKAAEWGKTVQDNMFDISRVMVFAGMVTLLAGHLGQAAFQGNTAALGTAAGRLAGVPGVMLTAAENYYARTLEDPDYEKNDMEKMLVMQPFLGIVKRLYNGRGIEARDDVKKKLAVPLMLMMGGGGALLTVSGETLSEKAGGLGITVNWGLWVAAMMTGSNGQELDEQATQQVITSQAAMNDAFTDALKAKKNGGEIDEQVVADAIIDMAESLAKLAKKQRMELAFDTSNYVSETARMVDQMLGTDLYHSHFMDIRVGYSNKRLDRDSRAYQDILALHPTEASIVPKVTGGADYALLVFEGSVPAVIASVAKFMSEQIHGAQNIEIEQKHMDSDEQQILTTVKASPAALRALAGLVAECEYHTLTDYLTTDDAKAYLDILLQDSPKRFPVLNAMAYEPDYVLPTVSAEPAFVAMG